LAGHCGDKKKKQQTKTQDKGQPGLREKILHKSAALYISYGLDKSSPYISNIMKKGNSCKNCLFYS
jgi:hypothetical protein